MPAEVDNKPKAGTAAAPAQPAAGGGAGTSRAPVAVQALGTGSAEAGALAVLGDRIEEQPPEELDTRLDRLPMRLDAMVKVHSFRVQDLLSMEKGTIVETVHEHTQDIPVRSGGALLVWAEFEVLDQRLAVRITRLG
jgi:flagellar motor switch/type III secretory pathway protein FliN